MAAQQLSAANRGAGQGARFRISNGTTYLCHLHHRTQAMVRWKSQWAISEQAEATVFENADSLNPASFIGTSDAWHVSPGARVVFGTKGERTVHYWAPTPGAVDWHGYPVGPGSPGRGQKSPPPEVIRDWQRRDHISRAIARKLLAELL